MVRHKVVLPVAYLVLRVALEGVSPIPGAIPVDPLPILLALWMRDRTQADPGALVFLPGVILGDLLAGLGVGPLLARSLMVCGFALTPARGEFHRRSWVWTFTYWFGTALVIDLQGWMPLGFLTVVGILQGFLWWGLLAPRAGGGPLQPIGTLLFPPIALFAIHLILPSPALWPFPVVGSHSSNWIRFFSFLVLLEPAIWRIVHETGSLRRFLFRQDLQDQQDRLGMI